MVEDVSSIVPHHSSTGDLRDLSPQSQTRQMELSILTFGRGQQTHIDEGYSRAEEVGGCENLEI